MDASGKNKPSASLADYLAIERTLLAWIRTGLSLMGFGFVVARFGLFLQEMQSVQHVPAVQNFGMSLWFGTALIIAGVVVNLLAGWHHARLSGSLIEGEHQPRNSVRLAVFTALFLALIGLGMAIYLISVRDSARAGNSAAEKEQAMSAVTNNGILAKRSTHSVDETLEKLKSILQAKSVTLFAVVDHSGEAQKAGLAMPPTKLVIFGNPKAGTPLMLAAPSSAIDLPLKILISQAADGSVWLSYNSPEYLQQRHALPQELLQNIAVVEALANAAAN